MIAACAGHAIAKGAFILLSSDYRIGATGPYKMGLNEVAIGITMHYAGIELANYRLALPYFDRAVSTAEIFNPEQACLAGFLDEVVEPDQVLARAHEVAAALSGHPQYESASSNQTQSQRRLSRRIG